MGLTIGSILARLVPITTLRESDTWLAECVGFGKSKVGNLTMRTFWSNEPRWQIILKFGMCLPISSSKKRR